MAHVYTELENTAPAIDIKELVKEQHAAFLKTPKIGNDFPKRSFDIPADELEIHNQFMEKLLAECFFHKKPENSTKNAKVYIMDDRISRGVKFV